MLHDKNCGAHTCAHRCCTVNDKYKSMEYTKLPIIRCCIVMYRVNVNSGHYSKYQKHFIHMCQHNKILYAKNCFLHYFSLTIFLDFTMGA